MATRPTVLVAWKAATSEGNAWARIPSSYVLSKSLAASTAESFTVPTALGPAGRARYVVFSAEVDFYANCYTAATVPGDVTDGTASEMNPVAYQIPEDVSEISVISETAGRITASFYA